jgi:tRNA 2-thiouridine synthesizing protein A
LAAAQREVEALAALKASSPMIAGLAATIRIAADDLPGAVTIYRDAMQRYPQSRSLVYGYAEALLAARQYEQGLRFLDSQVQTYSSDYKLYGCRPEPSPRAASACSSIGPRPSSISCRGSSDQPSNNCSSRNRRSMETSSNSRQSTRACVNCASCRQKKRSRRRMAFKIRAQFLSGPEAMHFDRELDVKGLNCPLPILRTKKTLSEMSPGEVLHVVATDPGSVKDFEAFARQTGNELLSSVEANKVFEYYLKRK